MADNEMMNELANAPEFREWLAEREAEAIEHEVAEIDGEMYTDEPDEFDYIQYTEYMGYLIAEATARIADDGQNGISQ